MRRAKWRKHVVDKAGGGGVIFATIHPWMIDHVQASTRARCLAMSNITFPSDLFHARTFEPHVRPPDVQIAARPGAHKLRCLFRVTFVPISAAQLAQRDLSALDYLYMQCCNDVTQERFAPELQPEVALRLAALHIHQHSLANNISPAKLTVKTVE